MSEEQIKPGYKKTEVGVIPEEWEVTTIGDVAEFSGGSQPPRYTFRFTPAKGYIRLIQIRDYKSDEFETYIPEALAQKRCTSKDIMIGRYGPPVFQILKGIDGAYNVALIKAIPSSRINSDYFFFFLKQEKLFQLIDALSRRSSGQTGVEMPVLKSYGLPLPPIHEQRAIATALSDVDSLLAQLDQLIAKKRDLKQATMQQLLTGQIRLPGFSGAWQVKRLGDVVEIRKGQLITEKTAILGSIPVIAGGMKPSYFHNQANRSGKTITISASGASAGYVAFHNYPIFASDCSTISESNNHDIDFIYFQLLLKQEEIYKAQTGGAQPHIHPSDLQPLQISICTREEQTAIATILSDMDTELATLQARRDKTHALKQGMMQELLTGRIRLI